MSIWEQASSEFIAARAAADELPRGRQQVQAFESILDLARRHGSFGEEFIARDDLAEALYHVADEPSLLTHLAWLRQHLGHPDIPDRQHFWVLWKLKWSWVRISSISTIPVSTWSAAIDDVAAAFTEHGYRLRPIHAARAQLAALQDNASVTDHELALWHEAPRDAMSDCLACEVHDRATTLSQRDLPAALDTLLEVFDNSLSCAEEPQLSRSHDALWRSQLGDATGAASSVSNAWALLSTDDSQPEGVARCLVAMVRIGNTDRAVAALLPRLPWFSNLPLASQRLWFGAAAAFVLDHGERLGLVPESIEGRPVRELAAELLDTAWEEARRFDARHGSTVVSSELTTWLDDSLVLDQPHLPTLKVAQRDPQEHHAPVPQSADDMLALAADITRIRRELDDDLGHRLAAWISGRTAVRARLSTPEQWAACAFLDWISVDLVTDPQANAAQGADAVEAARRSGDPRATAEAVASRATAELMRALAARESTDLEETRERARGAIAALAGGGWTVSWADALRWYAMHGAPVDPVSLLLQAAEAYASEGRVPRQALATMEAGLQVAPSNLERADELTSIGIRLANGHPRLTVGGLHTRARIARAQGDHDAAAALFVQALAIGDIPQQMAFSVSADYGDLLIDLQDWQTLESRATANMTLATQLGSPVALAIAQRQLGLAWTEMGRLAEAAELLEAALPVVRDELPDMLGPLGWALGNANAGLGSWSQARQAFATASLGFEAQGRVHEASHAQLRAGLAARDADDPAAAAAHFADAIDKAQASATVEVLFEALRHSAAIKARSEDVDQGLADLDAAADAAERFAKDNAIEVPAVELAGRRSLLARQGAFLLSEAGRVDEAVQRLDAALAQTGELEGLIVASEAGIILADADAVDRAEPRLRASLDSLESAGLDNERVEAAAALARALDRAGREQDADAVWQQYGPRG